MKVCIISHSNIHIRQQNFWRYFSKYAEVLVISPKQWFNLYTHDIDELNFKVFADDLINQDNMLQFMFSDKAYETIKKFKPDIIYNQNELWCLQSHVSASWAKALNCKFINFVWENIKEPDEQVKKLMEKCDLIIAGNKKAGELHNTNTILPQVGVDTMMFKPMDVKKEIDVLYIGRYVSEKGVDLIKEAYPNAVFINDEKYSKLPELYNKARLFVSFPYTTSNWKEQSGSYTNLEALSCGIPIVTSSCGAIPEYLEGCNASILIEEKDVEGLKKAIQHSLRVQIEDRQFIVKKYSYEAISKKLLGVFKNVQERT